MRVAADDPGLLPVAEALLGDADRARAALRKTPVARLRTALGRALLRLLAGELLGIGPREVTTATHPGGAPLARGPDGKELAVSVAHTGGLVVVAATDAAARVGVDAERLDRRTRPEAIARRHYTPAEAAALERVPEADRPAAFLRAWTLKEAWGKAAGVAVPSALSRVGFAMAQLAAPCAVPTARTPRWPPGHSQHAKAPWWFANADTEDHALGIAALLPGRSPRVEVRRVTGADFG